MEVRLLVEVWTGRVRQRKEPHVVNELQPASHFALGARGSRRQRIVIFAPPAVRHCLKRFDSSGEMVTWDVIRMRQFVMTKFGIALV